MQAEKIKIEAEYLAKFTRETAAVNKREQQKKNERIEKIKRDLQQSYEQKKSVQSSQFEQERIAEMKVQEYIRLQKRKEETLAEQKRIQDEKREKGFQKLCMSQLRATNSQEQKYEKWFRHELDKKEREYRQKELDAVKKRKEQQEKILMDRHLQQEEKVTFKILLYY